MEEERQVCVECGAEGVEPMGPEHPGLGECRECGHPQDWIGADVEAPR